MKKLVFMLTVATVLMVGCGSSNKGELVGVSDRPYFEDIDLKGMVFVSQGNYTMGAGTQNVTYGSSTTTQPRKMQIESFFMDDMDLVSQSGKLQLISKPTDICKGVHLELFNGHTPGQIAVFIDTPSENAIIPGDVIPLCPSINPFIISAYDLTPLESYSSKLTLLDHAVQHHSKLYFYHDVCTQSSFVGKDSKAQYHPLPSPPT